MMLVTSVTAIDKRRSRVVLDEEEAVILYGSDLSRFGIREGAPLDETVFAELLEKVLKPRARERILKALQVSDKTEQELRRLLAREGYPKDAVEDALAQWFAGLGVASPVTLADLSRVILGAAPIDRLEFAVNMQDIGSLTGVIPVEGTVQIGEIA